jgi:predicted NUDIX family NTP pyrophosphohydrolase
VPVVRSAGLLPYRLRDGRLEVLIAHMGGPFWAHKDEHAWSIVKGEYSSDEDALRAAEREFREETGLHAPTGPRLELGETRQAGGKSVRAWALEAELDETSLRSNTFTLEWPRGSGREREFPEVDRFAWCSPEQATVRLVKGQLPLLDALIAELRPELTDEEVH